MQIYREKEKDGRRRREKEGTSERAMSISGNKKADCRTRPVGTMALDRLADRQLCEFLMICIGKGNRQLKTMCLLCEHIYNQLLIASTFYLAAALPELAPYAKFPI